MTPAARIAAAIEVLDQVLAGEPAERVLTNWARSHRFAGSGDRAAIRDHVFVALRRRRSLAALGGAQTGRGLMLGGMRAEGVDPDTVFGVEGHAPPPLSAAERDGGCNPQPGAEALDCPDWLWPMLMADLGDAAETVLECQRHAAPVGLRANLRKTSRDALMAELARDRVPAHPHPDIPSALIADGRPRGLQTLAAFREGRVELQDAGSQRLAELVPLAPGQTMLDYCAGGGGKTLAVAARVEGRFLAHDASPRRMADLPARAGRAGVRVTLLKTGDDLPEADTVLCDAPCSGSGTWRRSPEAKWRLTPDGLQALTETQGRILDRAAGLVRPGGHLVYATCSILAVENTGVVNDFLARHAGFKTVFQHRIQPDWSSDGYYIAAMRAVPRG